MAAAAESGVELNIPSAPQLPVYLAWFWEGFMVLSGGRTMGFSGPNKIAISDVWAYLGILDVNDPVVRQEFLYYIARLDDRYLEIYAKKAPK